MSGILERIEARIEAIEAQLAQLLSSSHVSTTQVQTPTPTIEGARTDLEQANAAMEQQSEVKSPAETVTGEVASQVNPADSAELDINGVPWNETLHSGKPTDPAEKRQNQAGQWKMRRGADKAAYQQWRKDHMTTDGQGQTVTLTPTSAGTPPKTTPPPSVNTTTTPPPSTVGMSTPPNTVGEQVNPRAGILKEIQELTQTYGVAHEQVDDVLLEHGSDTVDAITPDQLPALEAKLKGWADYLELIQSLVDDAVAVDARIAKVNQGGVADGCGILMKQFNGDGVKVGTVPKDAVSGCHDALKDHVTQWVNWANGEGL